MSSHNRFRPVVLTVVGAIVLQFGCRPQEAARYSPSAEVAALTDDLEDADELKLYQELQSQIATVLQKRFGAPAAPKAASDDQESIDGLARGAAIYATYCVQCHGVNGDGRGELAKHLDPAPRDYTQGIFKFTSTTNGTPRKSDLVNTIRRGVRGTSMPSFATLSDDELGDVIDYVLLLMQRGRLQRELAQLAFDSGELPPDEEIGGIAEEILAPWYEANASVMSPLTPMPEFTPESVAAGRELFLKFACSRCHGVDGRGGTRGVDVGVDTWGQKAAAADLTSGMFRGGGRPIDVYRRIHTGITGTPMPGFANQFASDPDAIWHLVHFIEDTSERRRRGLPPLEAEPADDAVAPSDAATPAAPPTTAEEESVTSDDPAASDVPQTATDAADEDAAAADDEQSAK